MICPGFPGALSFFQVSQVEWEPCKPYMGTRHGAGVTWMVNGKAQVKRVRTCPGEGSLNDGVQCILSNGLSPTSWTHTHTTESITFATPLADARKHELDLKCYSPSHWQPKWSLKSVLAACLPFMACGHFSVSVEWYQSKPWGRRLGE